MYYETCADFVEDQFIKPMKEALKKGDLHEVQKAFYYLCYKYVELNAFSVGTEKAIKDVTDKEVTDIINIPIQQFYEKYVAPHLPPDTWCDDDEKEEEIEDENTIKN